MFPSSSQCVCFFAPQLLKPGAGMYFASTRRRGRRRERSTIYFTTSSGSRGVRQTNKEAAAGKDDSLDYRAMQEV